MWSVTKEPLVSSLWFYNNYSDFAAEIMITNHHYTNNSVDTAAAAVNAGTCLEDANSADNVFSHIGEAVTQVSVQVLLAYSHQYCVIIYRIKFRWTQ